MFSLFDTSTKLMLFLKEKMYSFCKPNKHQKQWILFISPFPNSLYAPVECKMLDCFEFCDLMEILIIFQPCKFASNSSEKLRGNW